MPWIVALWLTGVLALSLRLFGGWLRVRRLTRAGTRVAAQALQDSLEQLVARMRVSRPVRLLESTIIHVPAVVGWLRPVVLMPVSLNTGLTPQQLQVLLAHELAHVRRNDYAVNLLQAVVETFLFYHPVVWWVSRRIREERENCCDDIAVMVCGDPRAYAGTLVELEQLRSADLELAAAATGGSLFKRVRRLLTPPTTHSESEPRWIAAMLVLGLIVALSGRASLTASAQSIDTRVETADAETPQRQERGRAAPDTVIRYDGTASLEERWNWASNIARRNRYSSIWVAYAVGGDASRGWLYLDRHTSVFMAGGSMSGHMRMQRFDNLTFSGMKLGGLIGERDPEDLVLFYGFVLRDGQLTLDRTRASNFALPVHFGGRALLWLGSASDEESVELVRHVFTRTQDRDLARDLVSMAGAHIDSRVVVPVLSRWITSSDMTAVREEAVEWLSYHPTREALALLARTARSDRGSSVRAEAAEAVGDMQLPAAFDTLRVLARELEDANARREAVEAFGNRPERDVVNVLLSIARDDRDRSVQIEAVETLGDLEDHRGVEALRSLIANHPSVDVRVEAIETIGDAAEPADAIRILEGLLTRESDARVQMEAMETLGDLEDPRAMQIIERIARTHGNSELRREAVETLAQGKDPGAALEVLAMIARDPEQTVTVQVEAVETLGELDDQGVVRILEELAAGHPRREVQIEAVETLGDRHEESRAITALAELARSHPTPEVRREAIETYAEAATPEQARRLLATIVKSRVSVSEQVEALESLGEIDDPAAMDEIFEFARSHPEREVRRKALEIIGESDDARARTLLERLLRQR
jgi:beta-lactamase regulating signal transducer with metallopeptidase domain/HEAT repeat protein